MRNSTRVIVLLLCACVSVALSVLAFAADPPAKGKNADGDKELSGMSIVGNDEAPKSLVIVPWKTSDMGETLDVSKMIDDGKRPVDRDVFRRALEYYEIRTSDQP